MSPRSSDWALLGTGLPCWSLMVLPPANISAPTDATFISSSPHNDSPCMGRIPFFLIFRQASMPIPTGVSHHEVQVGIPHLILRNLSSSPIPA